MGQFFLDYLVLVQVTGNLTQYVEQPNLQEKRVLDIDCQLVPEGRSEFADDKFLHLLDSILPPEMVEVGPKLLPETAADILIVQEPVEYVEVIFVLRRFLVEITNNLPH